MRDLCMSCDCNTDRESARVCALLCRVSHPEMSTATNFVVDYISSGPKKLESPPQQSSGTVGSDRARAEQAAQVEASGGGPLRVATVAPMVGKWVSACFPEGSESTLRELEEVIREASDAARNDHDEASANEWAEGYEFPQQYVDSDVACLRSKMVARRLKKIAADRLSKERVERTLREDNPERDHMLDLAVGMTVHKPAGFEPNGKQPRPPLRAVYSSVSSAVNKTLGTIVKAKLAFLLPLSLALENVPNLHLCLNG